LKLLLRNLTAVFVFRFSLKFGIVLGRIEKFSFGDAVAGIIQPLEGDEKITDISKSEITDNLQITESPTITSPNHNVISQGPKLKSRFGG
jgi:hypothetical protein